MISGVLCVRSFWRSDLIAFRRMQQSNTSTVFAGHHEFWVRSRAGTFGIGWGIWNDSLAHPISGFDRVVRSEHTAAQLNLQLESTWRGNPFRTMWISSLYVPYPLLMLVFSLPCVVRWMRRRRLKQNDAMHLCRGCGYDLRATPERCPECGLVPLRNSVAG